MSIKRKSQMSRFNTNNLALTVQKLLARLKFQRGLNDRQDKKNMPPDL